MKILLLGGTGFIGQALRKDWRAQGHRVFLAIHRSCHSIEDNEWALPGDEWKRVLSQVDAVVNLAGETIIGRWTASKRRRIEQSRVPFAREIFATMQDHCHDSVPRVWINASAVGFYGHRPGEVLNESSPPGSGFLSQVCVAWEQEVLQAESLGVRPVCLRLGVVLGHGGFLKKVRFSFEMGLGTILGHGLQKMPWIHLDDVVGIINFSLFNSWQGPVNAVSPEVVSQKQFARMLALLCGRPLWLRIPRSFLRILWGEMSDLFLDDMLVKPQQLEKAGYSFRFIRLRRALQNLL